MTFDQFMELVGYLASLLVLVSLLMTSVIKLRIFNSLGAIIYVIYALTIKSYPTAIMNLCLVGINIWQLVRMNRGKATFTLRELAPREAGLQHFLAYFDGDIHKFFPGYAYEETQGQYVCMVYADADPAGLLVGTPDGDTMKVALDYSTPRFRDCSVGAFLYEGLKEKGYKKLEAVSETEAHGAYLKRMGFRLEGERYIKEL